MIYRLLTDVRSAAEKLTAEIADGEYVYENGYVDYPYGGRYYTSETIETATLK